MCLLLLYSKKLFQQTFKSDQKRWKNIETIKHFLLNETKFTLSIMLIPQTIDK